MCEWLKEITPDGWIALIGALLGAIATIVAVIITIRHESKKAREEKIIANQPWLTSENKLLCKAIELEDAQNEKNLFVYLTEDSRFASSFFPPHHTNNNYHFNTTECAIFYTFENVGGNTASDMQILINGQPLMPEFAFPIHKERSLIFFFPKQNGCDETIYEIAFEYGDIVSNIRYRQSEIFHVKKDKYGVTLSFSPNERLTKPIRTKSKNRSRRNG